MGSQSKLRHPGMELKDLCIFQILPSLKEIKINRFLPQCIICANLHAVFLRIIQPEHEFHRQQNKSSRLYLAGEDLPEWTQNKYL